jgi:hypothetical protein
MKKTTQKTFPNLTDFREPKTVAGNGLKSLIDEAAKIGWTANRMRVIQNGVYEVSFIRLSQNKTIQ